MIEDPKKLWFDVESIILATIPITHTLINKLWFDVESIILATLTLLTPAINSCGLM